MGKIVEFPGKEPEEDMRLVWHCTLCGCSSFSLFSDGSCACAGCKYESDGQEWVKNLPDINYAQVTRDDAGAILSIAHGSVIHARKATVEFVNQNSDQIAFIGCWLQDGHSRLWEDIQCVDQQQWALRRLDELRAFVSAFQFTHPSPASDDISPSATEPASSTDPSLDVLPAAPSES